MFRARQLSNLLTILPKRTIPVSINEQSVFSLGYSINGNTRHYCAKNTKTGKVGNRKNIRSHSGLSSSDKTNKSKINLKEVKPIDINPFKKAAKDSTVKVPSIQECAPNWMSETPGPSGPFEEHDAKYRKQYKKVLIFGLLFSAVTLATAYKVGIVDQIDDKGPKKPRRLRGKKVVTKFPDTSKEIPEKVPYLLIGGGTASFTAFRAIKSTDPTARVLVISDETHFPYMRPPLSKEIWFNDDTESVKKLNFKQWNGSERSLFYEPEDFYIPCAQLMATENGGVAVARGWKINSIDVVGHKAILDDGKAIEYDKCLIATGTRPKTLPVFDSAMSLDASIQENVKVFRNIHDFEDLSYLFEKSKTIAVIGGGFLGSELSCALARKGKAKQKHIIQVFKEGGSMGKVLPEYLSFWTTDKVSSEGVDVKTNTEVVNVVKENNHLILTLKSGKKLKVDSVIIAVGVKPNTELAETSDLELDPELGGFLVNSELQARTDLYIAGDCACFYDPQLGRRRIEHHDHAVVSGRLAGENMTGAGKPYVHQSMFWSDLGPDVGYEAIGIVDSSLPTVGVFAKATYKDNPQAVVTASGDSDRSKTEEVPKDCNKHLTDEQKEQLRELKRSQHKPNAENGEDFGKGVIFYLKDDIVVGILLWNVFNRMPVARAVLKDHKKYDDLNEVAKLFTIHEE